MTSQSETPANRWNLWTSAPVSPLSMFAAAVDPEGNQLLIGFGLARKYRVGRYIIHLCEGESHKDLQCRIMRFIMHNLVLKEDSDRTDPTRSIQEAAINQATSARQSDWK